MQRNINDFENEIVNQVLVCEICFDICKEIPIIPGSGSNFLPFYYNLNFSKGIISLHSLLLSNLPNELSIKNYLKQYKLDFPNIDINDFENEIILISKSFKDIFPIQLRNKVFAHIDKEFKHTDFTNAYTMPNLVEKYILIIQNLKNVFFKFCNHSQNDYPFIEILQQSKLIIKDIADISKTNYTL